MANPLPVANLRAVLPDLDLLDQWLVPEEPPEGTQLVPALAFLAPGVLAGTLAEAAAHWGTADMRVAASLWSKWYCAALLSPILGAFTLADVGLDGSAGQITMAVRAGLPRGILPHGVLARETPAPHRDQVRRSVLTGLFSEHLVPLVAHLHRLSGLPVRVMWCNAGNLCADLFDRLGRRQDAPPTVADDRRVLMEEPWDWATPHHNPLSGTVRYEETGEPAPLATVRIRQVCCLRHQIPGMTTCSTCPLLTAEARLALIRDLARDRT